MEITKLKKGERATLPCSVIGGHDGATSGGAAPEDGAIIRFDALEKANGAVFVPDAALEKAGYTVERSCHERTQTLFVLLGRDELVEFASRIGIKASGTKKDLAERIAARL